MPSLDRMDHVFSIIGVVGGLIGVIVALVQIVKGNDIKRAENGQKLVEMALSYNAALLQDPELFSISQRGNDIKAGGYNKLANNQEKERFKLCWISYLNILEGAYFLQKDNLIDKNIYSIYIKDIHRSKDEIMQIWSEIKRYYSLEFQRVVEAP